MSGRGHQKEGIFKFFGRPPVLAEMGDPVIGGVLAIFGVLAGVSVVLAPEIFPNDVDARTHVLQMATGVIVLLGFYFVAVNLRTVRATNYSDRLMKALDQLAIKSEPIQIGAVRLLEGLAREEPELPQDAASRQAAKARRRAVRDVLWALCDKAEYESVKALACEIKEALVDDGWDAEALP